MTTQHVCFLCGQYHKCKWVTLKKMSSGQPFWKLPSTLHSGQSLAWDHIQGIADPCGPGRKKYSLLRDKYLPGDSRIRYFR